MRHPLRTASVALPAVLLLLVGAWAPGLHAQGTVAFQVQVIYAANQPGGVDSRLGALAGDLQRTFRYSMYQLLDAPGGSAALNQPWRTRLPGDRGLEIVPTAIRDGQYHLAVRVLGPDGQALVNTTVRLRRGARPVLVGGLSHEQGVLIVAISAG